MDKLTKAIARALTDEALDDDDIDNFDWFDERQVRQTANAAAKAALQAIKDSGWAVVPVQPTEAMKNAAIDVDSFKLGDISPLGFRITPQILFKRCYKAMIAAAQEEG